MNAAASNSNDPSRAIAALQARPGAARQCDALQALGRKIDADTPAGRRETAGLLVAELAFKPLLAEMRKSSLAAGPFDGGRGGEVFGERLDEALADAVAQSDPGGVTSQIARYLDPTAGRAALRADGAPLVAGLSGTPSGKKP